MGPTPWEGRAILHVDMDAFFASVEQLDHPEWRGLPVVVGGDPAQRGVISAASYEARRFGIHSAMPSARAAALCPDAVWARPRGQRYREVSEEVLAILIGETPYVQPTSIDEAYADVTPGSHAYQDPIAIASRIQDKVSAIGITCSIGVATSKTVAKIASDAEKPCGLTVVGPGKDREFLAPLSVRVMPGIGAVGAERLEKLGITTLGKVADLDEESAREVLGSWGQNLVKRARGIDERPVRDSEARRSVSNERTFAADAHSAAEVRTAISALALKVAGRLREKGLTGRTVTVKVRYGDFTTRTVRRTIPTPTDAGERISEVASELLNSVWSPGVGIRLLGVGVSGFEERAVQMQLVDAGDPSDPEHERLTRTVDEVHKRFGEKALGYGSSAVSRPDGVRDRDGDTENGRVK